jgi:hypothetical protein
MQVASFEADFSVVDNGIRRQVTLARKVFILHFDSISSIISAQCNLINYPDFQILGRIASPTETYF